jgi:hypothetical protein
MWSISTGEEPRIRRVRIHYNTRYIKVAQNNGFDFHMHQAFRLRTSKANRRGLNQKRKADS